MPVGEAVDRDDGLAQVQAAGEVERGTEWGGAPEVPGLRELAGMRSVTVDDQPRAGAQAR